MRRFAATALLVLLLCLVLSACSEDAIGSGNAADDKTGVVNIVSNGETHTLSGKWTSSFSSNGDGTGTARDGERIKIEDIAQECTEVTYAKDFLILLDGQHHGTIGYMLYNEQYEEIKLEYNRLEHPLQTGVHYLNISITWGDEMNYASYEYYCKIIV